MIGEFFGDLWDGFVDIFMRTIGMDEDGDFSIGTLFGGVVGVGVFGGVLAAWNRKVFERLPIADQFAEAWLWAHSGKFVEDMLPGEASTTYPIGAVYKDRKALTSAGQSPKGKQLLRDYKKARGGR